jgi:Pectate lyase superfamily protein
MSYNPSLSNCGDKKKAISTIKRMVTVISFLLAMLCPSAAFGQQPVFRLQGTVQTPLGAAVAGANVAICSQPATLTSQPCTPLATLYNAPSTNTTSLTGASYAVQQITFALAIVPSDVVAGSYISITGASPSGYNGVWLVASVSGLNVTIANVFSNPGSYITGGTVTTSALPNPVQTNGNGYFYAYVASNPYTVQVYSSTIQTLVYADQYPLGGGGGGGGTPGGVDTNVQVNGSGVFIGPSGLIYTYGATPPVLSIPGNLRVKSGQPWYDVTAWGAHGDGVTDDTAAINAAYAQAASDLNATGTGGGGTVYFPHSTGCYKFSTINIPTGTHGWIVSVFDSGLCGNTVVPGNQSAFIGHSGSFQGLSGSFLYAPSVSWTNPTTQSAPLVDLNGVTQVYFEGIDLEGFSTTAVIHSHDNSGAGSTWEIFSKCVINNNSSGAAYLADASSSSQVSGFGFRSEYSSWSGPANLTFTNFNMITFEHSFIGGNSSVVVNNAGVPSDGDVVFDDVLSEGLVGKDFAIATGTYVNDWTFRDTRVVDFTAPVYMFNNLSTNGLRGPVHFDMNPVGAIGNGLMDPAGFYPQVYCEGASASTTGCPAYTDSIPNNLSTPPPAPAIFQDRQWYDMSDNWRCLTHAGGVCGMVVGNFLASFITDAAWSTSSGLCTDASSPPRAVTAGCSPGVANLTPVPRVLVNGANSGTLLTTTAGQCPGGSGSSASYPYVASDFSCIVTRGASTAMTDTLPQAGSAGFASNFYLSISNTGTALDTITTTTSTFTCVDNSPYCSGSTLKIPAGKLSTIWSPDNANWNVAMGGAIGTQDYSPNYYGVGGGTANAQTVTLSPGPTSYVTGMDFCWVPTNNNTTSGATINANGIGTLGLYKSNGSSYVSLVANDLVAGVLTCAKVITSPTAALILNPQTFTAGGNTIVSSPQYQIPYYSTSGTSNALTGSPNVVTDVNGDIITQTPVASAVASSPGVFVEGVYQTGVSAYAADSWGWNDIIGAGTNGTSTLTLVHSGTSGATSISFPGLNFNAGAIKALLAATNVTIQSGINSGATQGTFTATGGNVTGGSGAFSAGAANLTGGSNASTSGSSNAGDAVVEAGNSTAGGKQGHAKMLQSFTVASALSNAHEVVCMTTTAYQVAACPLAANNIVGEAETVGGTGTQIFVGTAGQFTLIFDGTPVVGDVACGPPASTGTIGFAHDNGSTACTAGEYTGVVIGDVSGTGSGATATVLINK